MVTRPCRPLALAVLAATAVLLAPPAGAQDATTTPTRRLLYQGDVIPGAPVSPTVSGAPLRLSYGPGGWVMDVTMTGNNELVFGEAGPAVYEGQSLVGGTSLVADPWLSFDADSSGVVSSVVVLSGGDTALALDDVQVLTEGDVLGAPELEVGTTWEVITAATFDGVGHIVVRGEVVQPSAPAETEDVLVRYDVAGTAISSPTVLVSTLDTIDGRELTEVGYVDDLCFDLNASGQLLHTVRFAPASGTGVGPAAIVLDGVVLAESGTESIVPGRDWDVHPGATVALNDAGSWAFEAEIEAGAFGLADVVVHDNQLVTIEGAPVPGVPDSKIKRLQSPRLGDDGTLAYFVTWETTPFSDKHGVMVDGELAVGMLITPLEDSVVGYMIAAGRQYDLSDDGTRFHFIGSIQSVAGWGVYEAPTGPWADLGFELAGTGGVAPQLFGLGSLKPASTLTLELTGAPPSTVTTLVVGTSLLAAPFKGGTLGPHPDVLLSLPVGADGGFAFASPFPPGLPAGVGLHLQAWTPDAGAPSGLSASNTLRATTP